MSWIVRTTARRGCGWYFAGVDAHGDETFVSGQRGALRFGTRDFALLAAGGIGDARVVRLRRASIVREIDGQLVLDDPDAVAMVRAVAKANCRQLFEMNAERVAHFRERARAHATPTAIVLINVDDVHGGPMADALMPGTDWQPFRDRGELPLARGLAGREGIEAALASFDPEAAEKLGALQGLAVVVVDHGVAEVFEAAP